MLGIAILSCFVAALFGAAPLAAWVDASILSGTVVQQVADSWHELTQRVGFDRPYEALRRAVREAEAAP
ncbi:MAG TPA: hypothetical protein VGI78_20890 [Acetobacteraceae bacterium]